MASATRAISTEIKDSAVAIGATAAKLPATPLGGRRTMLVQNLGPGTLYVGKSTVTTSTGIKIPSGSKEPFDIQDTVHLYGIGDGDCDVRVLEGY